MVAHCLFEQSGTFKNEFINMGFKAYDYDVKNKFNQTDFVIDLFDEIDKAYNNNKSIFDNISQDDIVVAFFPCTRFTQQAELLFTCKNYSMRTWSDLKKLNYCMALEDERCELYKSFCKLCIVCIKKNIKLIIENPWRGNHYLVKYFPLQAKLIDTNRRELGDNFIKATQYWFINCEPKKNNNIEILLPNITKKTITKQTINHRSWFTKEYANNFIRKYIL